MAKVTTELFKTSNTQNFFNSFASDRIYLVASSIDNPTGAVLKSEFDKRLFLSRVVFGNRLQTSDLRFMFDRNSWSESTIYDEYDDRLDLDALNYYVSVFDGDTDEGDYRIFKCIKNNYRSRSIYSPASVSLSEYDDGYFSTPDGYTWKFMFAVDAAEYTKYQTSDLLPYDTTLTKSGNDGIYNIKITENTRFAQEIFSTFEIGTGRITSVDQVAGGFITRIQTESTVQIRSDENAYKNMYLEVQGKVYEIIGSTKPVGVNNILQVKTLLNPNPDSNATNCFIKPQIRVSNSNTGGSPCVASGIVDADGRLVDIHFNSHGSGYTFADAELILPPSIETQGSTAISLRPILSPNGGHGSDPITELRMSRLSIVSRIYSDPERVTPDSNFYSKLGLVRNPVFVDTEQQTPVDFDNRRTFVCAGDVTAFVEVGNFVTQSANDEEISARVHEVEYDSELELTYVYVVDYIGNTFTDFVTGEAFVKNTLDSTTAISFTINTIDEGDYVDMTGDLIHFVDFEPIERDPDSIEKVKFIFDF